MAAPAAAPPVSDMIAPSLTASAGVPSTVVGSPVAGGSPSLPHSDSGMARSRSFANSKEASGGFNKRDVTLEDLKRLKAVFDKATEAGDGQLTEEQFLDAFAPILGRSMSEEQLRLWFMRVDASANGAVDWDEFSSFLLYTSDRSETIVTSSGVAIDEVSFVKDPRSAVANPVEASATRTSGYNHADLMTKVLVHPRNGKLYSSGQDGTIRVWDAATTEFETMLHHGKGWITDMGLGRDATKIVAITVDRHILIYDVHTEKLSRGFAGTLQLSNSNNGGTTHGDKPSSDANRQQLLLRGPAVAHEVPWIRPVSRGEIDTRHVSAAKKPMESLDEYRQRHERNRHGRGTDATVKFSTLSAMEVPALCLAVVPANATPEGTEQVFMGLTDGSVQAYEVFAHAHMPETVDPTLHLPNLHGGFVTSIKWVSGLASCVSTGSDGKIFLINPHKKTATRVCERYATDHPIHTCEWISSERLLATCGNDRNVLLWSINSRGPPIPLKGHLAAVAHLHYREEDNLLFTLDHDKCIKVWDVRTLRPIQSMVDYETYQPVDRLTVLNYDPRRHCLVTGVVAPVLWSMGRLLVPYPDPAYTGHQKAVHTVLHNPVFHQIVTADTDYVKFWSVQDGTLMSTLTVETLRATAVSNSLSSAAYGAIYSIAFDFSFRRLLVGATSGVVFICNFANGQLLQELVPQLPDRDKRDYSAAEASILAYYRAGVKYYTACIRASEMLIWEDLAEGTLEKRLDRVVNLALTKKAFAYSAVSPPSAEFLAGAAGTVRWRTPTPLCMCGMPPGHLAIGTDCGLIIVYSSLSMEVLSVFGAFDLNINVTTLFFDEKRETLFAGRSDSTVYVVSQVYKDMQFSISLRDPIHGRTPNVTTIDILHNVLALGTDDGYVMLFDVTDFSLIDLEACKRYTATMFHPENNCRLLGGFQCHKEDVCRVALFIDSDDTHASDDVVSMQLITAAVDCQARLWVLRTAEEATTAAPGGSISVNDTSMSPPLISQPPAAPRESEPNSLENTQRTTVSDPSGVPCERPLFVAEVDFVGYCGKAWKRTKTMPRLKALLSIPAPLVHHTLDYFEVARKCYEARIAREKQLVQKTSITSPAPEKNLLGVNEPMMASARAKAQSDHQRRREIEGLIASPPLRAPSMRRGDGATLLLSDTDWSPSRDAVVRNSEDQSPLTKKLSVATFTRGTIKSTLKTAPRPGSRSGAKVEIASKARSLTTRQVQSRSKLLKQQQTLTSPRLHDGECSSTSATPHPAGLAQFSPGAVSLPTALTQNGSVSASPQAFLYQPQHSPMGTAGATVTLPSVHAGNQTPRLPALPGIASAVSASSRVPTTLRDRAESSLVKLPQLDLSSATLLQQRDVDSSRLANNASRGVPTFLLSPRGAMGATSSMMSMTRSPGRDVLIAISRQASAIAEKDREVEDEVEAELLAQAMEAPASPLAEERARQLAKERRMPISARVDHWRRAQQTKPPATELGGSWTARPHIRLGLPKMDSDFVGASSASKRRQQLALLEVDQRLAKRRGLNV
jgi:WD40 repeat protein